MGREEEAADFIFFLAKKKKHQHNNTTFYLHFLSKCLCLLKSVFLTTITTYLMTMNPILASDLLTIIT